MNENLANEIRKTIESVKDMKIQASGINNYLSILEGMIRADYQKQVDDAYQRGYNKGYADKTNNDKVGKELAKMTIKDMITRLNTKERMEVRDEQGYELFTCDTDSAMMFDYWDREVIKWFPRPAPNRVCDFTVFIKDERI